MNLWRHQYRSVQHFAVLSSLESHDSDLRNHFQNIFFLVLRLRTTTLLGPVKVAVHPIVGQGSDGTGVRRKEQDLRILEALGGAKIAPVR